jgi:hypothetical protein
VLCYSHPIDAQARQDDAPGCAILSGYRAFVKIVPMRLDENHLMYIRKIHGTASLAFAAMESVHDA